MSSSGCDWTARYSCPTQPAGSAGTASDDGTEGFDCCCSERLWDTQVLWGEGTDSRRGQTQTSSFAFSNGDIVKIKDEGSGGAINLKSFTIDTPPLNLTNSGFTYDASGSGMAITNYSYATLSGPSDAKCYSKLGEFSMRRCMGT